MGRAGGVKTWCASAPPNSGARAGRKKLRKLFRALGHRKDMFPISPMRPPFSRAGVTFLLPLELLRPCWKMDSCSVFDEVEWLISHSAVEELQCLYRERNGNGLPGVKSLELHSGGRPSRTNPPGRRVIPLENNDPAGLKVARRIKKQPAELRGIKGGRRDRVFANETSPRN